MAKVRSLTMHRVTVPPKDRKKYQKQIEERAKHYASGNCRFWVFEDTEIPCIFIEFVEADDEKTLIEMHATAPGQVLGPKPIYHQVEIS